MEIPEPSSISQANARFSGLTSSQIQDCIARIYPFPQNEKIHSAKYASQAISSTGAHKDFREKDYIESHRMLQGVLTNPWISVADIDHPDRTDISYMDSGFSDVKDLQTQMIGQLAGAPQLNDPRHVFVENLLKMKIHQKNPENNSYDYMKDLFLTQVDHGMSYYQNQAMAQKIHHDNHTSEQLQSIKPFDHSQTIRSVTIGTMDVSHAKRPRNMVVRTTGVFSHNTKRAKLDELHARFASQIPASEYDDFTHPIVPMARVPSAQSSITSHHTGTGGGSSTGSSSGSSHHTGSGSGSSTGSSSGSSHHTGTGGGSSHHTGSGSGSSHHTGTGGGSSHHTGSGSGSSHKSSSSHAQNVAAAAQGMTTPHRHPGGGSASASSTTPPSTPPANAKTDALAGTGISPSNTPVAAAASTQSSTPPSNPITQAVGSAKKLINKITGRDKKDAKQAAAAPNNSAQHDPSAAKPAPSSIPLGQSQIPKRKNPPAIDPATVSPQLVDKTLSSRGGRSVQVFSDAQVRGKGANKTAADSKSTGTSSKPAGSKTASSKSTASTASTAQPKTTTRSGRESKHPDRFGGK